MRPDPNKLARLGELALVEDDIRRNLDALEKERAHLKQCIAAERALPEPPAPPAEETES